MIAKSPLNEGNDELVAQISFELRQLSNDKLTAVREFVALLASKSRGDICFDESIPREITLASEAALRKFWDSAEEDAAWAHL